MQDKIESILLIVKQNHAQAVQTGQQVQAWLEDHGIRARQIWSHQAANDIRAAAQGVNLALILGGDGVMLAVGRALAGKGVALAGINFGRVGFLAEMSSHNWPEYLTDLLKGAFVRANYPALAWRLLEGDQLLAHGPAINDVVLARGEVARAVALDLRINNQLFSRLFCDGAIVSAPLGSTAYACSAGGPLTYPDLPVQVVTPISPFAGAFPPLVLPLHAQIRLDPAAMGQDVRLTVDGQESFAVSYGQHLEVCGALDQILFVVRDPDWYLKRLRERGLVQSGPHNNQPG